MFRNDGKLDWWWVEKLRHEYRAVVGNEYEVKKWIEKGIDKIDCKNDRKYLIASFSIIIRNILIKLDSYIFE